MIKTKYKKNEREGIIYWDKRRCAGDVVGTAWSRNVQNQLLLYILYTILYYTGTSEDINGIWPARTRGGLRVAVNGKRLDWFTRSQERRKSIRGAYIALYRSPPKDRKEKKKKKKLTKLPRVHAQSSRESPWTFYRKISFHNRRAMTNI